MKSSSPAQYQQASISLKSARRFFSGPAGFVYAVDGVHDALAQGPVVGGVDVRR